MAIAHNQVESHSDLHIDPQPVGRAEVPNCSTGRKLLCGEKHPQPCFNKRGAPTNPHRMPTQETTNSKTCAVRLQFRTLRAIIREEHTFGKYYASSTSQPQTPDKVPLCRYRERCNPDVSVIHILGHEELTGNGVTSDSFRNLSCCSDGGKRKK